MKIIEELKRRNVFRVGIAYLVVAWLLLQVADLVLENINAPDWVMQVFMLALALGFPLALIFAWAFEMTPDGLKRERDIERSQSISPQTGKKLDRMIIIVMGLVIAFLLVDRFYLQGRSSAPSAEQASVAEVEETKSIAVLPFADLSQEQDQRWFADGLAEEILNALARTPDLLVSSRTSSFKYRDTDLDILQIAQELGVAHVLEGSVRGGGDRIRVTAQLIRASDGFHVWSQNYDRDVADMISIQEDLARSIAQALETTMDPAALAAMTQSGTRSVAAYEAYLRGVDLGFVLQGDTDAGNLKRAYEFFEEARRLDPGFARAHQSAAAYWAVQLTPTRTDFGSSELPLAERMAAYTERIEQAIEHAASEEDRTRYLANQADIGLRMSEALRLYLDYFAARPNEIDGIGDMTNLAIHTSRPDVVVGALETIRERAMTEPQAAVTYLNQAYRIIGAEAAADFVYRLRERYNDNPGAQYQAHRTLLWAGRYAEARRAYERFMQLVPAGDLILEARQACVEGDRARAEAILDTVDTSQGTGLSERWHILMLLDRRADAEELLRPLESLDTPLMLSSWLGYAQFDPRPFPSLMAVLEREGIKRPLPVEIPFKCPPPEETSIAVLPFVNMSADAENEFFSDGVSEEILNVLARIPELKVAARTSAFTFKNSSASIADIARELGVNHVLEGSVRKAGDQVRVTAQLIKADDGFHLWSDTYDRQLDNIFAIQDEIAGAIADALKVPLGLEAGATGNLTGTTNLQAYEHYLQGMSLWHLRTRSSLEQAIDEFQQAIDLDPGFAKAHAGLALAWGVLPGYKVIDSQAAYTSGIAAANRALQLDAENVEALIALALVYRYQWDFARSNELFLRAIDLNPSLATAHQWYGSLLHAKGDIDASLESYQRAWRLDPRSRIIGQNLALQLASVNRREEAMSIIDEVLEFAPEFPDGLSAKFHLALTIGNCVMAAEAGNRLAAALGKETNSTPIYLDLCPGNDAQSRRAAIDTITAWQPFDFSEPAHPTLSYEYAFISLLVELGEMDAAFTFLQGSDEVTRAWVLGEFRFGRTENSRRFHCDPRIAKIEDSLSIPVYARETSCE